MGILTPEESERFWGHVRRGSGCWPWTRAIHKKSGYGQVAIRGKTLWAHRVAYIERVGPLPDGAPLDHTCHTNDPTCEDGPACRHRRCCRPDHLERVTTLENTLRGRGITAKEARSETCGAGHPFDERNTRWQFRQGVRRRICRKCEADKARARRAAKRRHGR